MGKPADRQFAVRMGLRSLRDVLVRKSVVRTTGRGLQGWVGCGRRAGPLPPRSLRLHSARVSGQPHEREIIFFQTPQGYKNLPLISEPSLSSRSDHHLFLPNPLSLPLKNTQNSNGQSRFSSLLQGLHPMLINLFPYLIRSKSGSTGVSSSCPLPSYFSHSLPFHLNISFGKSSASCR